MLLLLIVAGLALCYVSSSTSIAVKGIVITIWYLVICIVGNLVLGYVGVPLVTLLFAGSLIVYFIKSVSKREQRNLETRLNPDRRPSLFQQIDKNILEESFGIIDDNDCGALELGNKTAEVPKMVDVNSLPYLSGQRNEDNLRKRHNVQFEENEDHSMEVVSKPNKPDPSLHSSYSLDSSPVDKKKSILKKDESVEPLSSKSGIFLILTTTCLIVFVWRNMWLLLILMPVIAWIAIRRFVLSNFSSSGYDQVRQALKSVYSSKQSAIFPQPIPIFIKLCINLDRCLLRGIKSSVSPIISGGIIMAMIVGGVGAFVFFLLQVQVELAYSVSMMKNVVDTSVAQSPWIQRYTSVHVYMLCIHVHVMYTCMYRRMIY